MKRRFISNQRKKILLWGRGGIPSFKRTEAKTRHQLLHHFIQTPNTTVIKQLNTYKKVKNDVYNKEIVIQKRLIICLHQISFELGENI